MYITPYHRDLLNKSIPADWDEVNMLLGMEHGAWSKEKMWDVRYEI
jgi:hypothetical protein